MEKINIAELLKDCPKGMELDCTMYDNLSYDYIDKEQNRIYCKVDLRDTVWFTIYGCVNLSPSAKCVIFPKGKTTWEGFVPPCKFKDGDVCYVKTKTLYEYIFIFKVSKNYDVCTENYVTLSAYELYTDTSSVCATHSIKEIRLATEEEKQKLFDAIKANGYKWNAETKTLEKLPKFKVWDRVKHISAYTSGIVVKVDDKGYYIDYPKGEGVCFISFTLEKDYELAPNKFDFTTLKPFESKVLVRDYDNRMWIPTFWGKYLEDDSNCRYLTTGGCYRYCIPYNEETKHLLGTTNDCDDFYKTWE